MYLFGISRENLTEIFTACVHPIVHIQFVLPLQGNGHFAIVTEGVALGYGVKWPFRPLARRGHLGCTPFAPYQDRLFLNSKPRAQRLAYSMRRSFLIVFSVDFSSSVISDA